ncbi:MAG: AAA family ATPase, partial [Longilinea sp.]|nr:AAA family ATPase [Longilinea sp.]
MTEIQTLLHAIAALEAQRSSLGDDVVNAALAPMRQKLALLQGQAQLAENQRKQITVLFANITGLAAPSENLDIEESRDMIQDVWKRLDPIIISHGGAIDKHIGDTVMALWGTSVVREDDPERAIKAALAMQAALTAFCKERHLGLSIRIGLNTGPVLLGEVGSTHEFTAMGDTVNLASRLESAAPEDGILIAHNTYRHVNGMFDVQVQPPLTVKGKAEPIQTYLVLRAKQRQFWVATRGVEGIRTHMIGRDVELAYLQSTLGTVAEQRKLQMVTLVAEAGLGKSRLLREFDAWLETYQKSCVVIRGRASQEMQSVPYALLRDIFSFRFQIQDRDPLKTVQEKMETGIGAGASVSGAAWPASESPMRAHIIGHWIGFDLSESPYLTEILEDAQQIRDRALIYLVDYFKSLTESSTIVILLEDIHWADDSSLDVFEHLGHMLSRHPVLIITAARPSLFDRRPSWASGQPVQNR